MRFSFTRALGIGVCCMGLWCSLASRSVSASDQEMVQADHAFVQAVAKADKAALGKLLDANFTWTDSDGETESRTQVLQELPRPGINNETGAELKTYTYGQAGDVQANLGLVHVLRVWVKRPSGWRALAYQEVTSLDKTPSFAPGAGKVCVNPCKEVSYRPKNETERQVITAYEGLETVAEAHNSAKFAMYVADEFIAASSNSNKVYDKRSRMADFDRSKVAGVAPTPLISARMFDFDDVVVMISIHRPDRGKPLHVTRIWVKRDGRWMETLSYQTTIKVGLAKP
ncbi:MAG TPA: nuclear transport factor 2 family protein [Candidatus Acidoferrales bacterium]|nr:nuclear transport factor 2 family protein [Candidatus Acidoferrales bacterium]